MPNNYTKMLNVGNLVLIKIKLTKLYTTDVNKWNKRS